MKICMVSEYLAPEGKAPLGGVEERTINLAKNLAKQDNELHIINGKLMYIVRKMYWRLMWI